MRRTAVREQALRAVAELGGPDSARAESTLIALGPFGLDALEAMPHQGSRGRAVAEHVRSAIAAEWPDGRPALDVLGKDAAEWRRWYRQARKVL